MVKPTRTPFRNEPSRSGTLVTEQPEGARLPILTPGSLPKPTEDAYNQIREAAMKVILRQEDQTKRDFLAKEYSHYLHEWSQTAHQVVHEQHALVARHGDPYRAEQIAQMHGAHFTQKINERLLHRGVGSREAMNLLADELNPSLPRRYLNLLYDQDKGRKEGVFEGMKFDGILGAALGGLGAIKLFEMGGGTLLAGIGGALFAVGATVATPWLLSKAGLTTSSDSAKSKSDALVNARTRTRGGPFEELENALQKDATASAAPDLKSLAAKAGDVPKTEGAKDMGDKPHAGTFKAATTPAPEKLSGKETTLRA